MEHERWILHADMDAFYASIEQRDRPELRGLPVIVGAAYARGVVAAASYEARKFGVYSAMPGFRARELCPNGVFLPSNMTRYAEVSAQVHAVFQEFTPDIEPLALDEAFLDITGSVRLFHGPQKLAERLKARVLEATELNISVGVAPSKLVAKIACSLCKPNGLSIIEPNAVRALLDPLPVRRLWGVGPVLGQTLHELNIHTFADLANYDPARLVELLGPRALELQRLARGQDTRGVESERAPKSVGEENTFEKDITDADVVSAALTAHADTVARRLRAIGYAARTVTLKIKLGKSRGKKAPRLSADLAPPDYPLLSRSRTLNAATNDGFLIRDVALDLWHRARITEPVRLLGVSVSSLEQGGEQLDLFEAREAPRAELGKALDQIRNRFGKSAIGPAVSEPTKITPSLRRKLGDD